MKNLFLILLLFLTFVVSGQIKSLPDGQALPKDIRLKPLKDLNGYFPFYPSHSKEGWAARKQSVKERILVANGLWPLPEKTPLNAVVHGKNDCGEYTVEKVYFESVPGFFVTGSLYRPVGKKGKRPAVVSPHGHWDKGRFTDAGKQNAEKYIADGAEKFLSGGRSHIQARCVHLARMGYIVFQYDMIGYADCQQLSFELVHRFAKQRPEMNSAENWGFYSPQAETRLQSIFGLQTWNSIRAVDFLLTLEDVDPEKLAVTGASGGGTQSMILAAIDDRISVSMPAVMVSTAMQGGCTCENASLMRINTGNVEFSALFAPKPQGLTAADDWTKELASKGFPQLKEHYKKLGAPDNIILCNHTEFKHNYNAVSRLAMYQLFNKHFGIDTDVNERDFKYLTEKELSVWDDVHPKPAGGDEFERKLNRTLKEMWMKKFNELVPTDKGSLTDYRKVIGTGINTVIGYSLPALNNVYFKKTRDSDSKDFKSAYGMTVNSELRSELPTVILTPESGDGDFVIWVTVEGKSGLFEKDGKPIPAVQKLLANGKTVIGVDLLFQGEFIKQGEEYKEARKVENPRESAAYTHGYNHSLFANRVHDILTVISLSKRMRAKKINLAGINGAGHWVAAAKAQAGSAIYSTAIETNKFRFSEIADIRHLDFQPGGAKYGDIEGMISLAAPEKMWIKKADFANIGLIQKVFESAGSSSSLKISDNSGASSLEIAEWIISQ